MNVTDVAEEIAARLDTIDGLNVFSYQPNAIVPPAAWVANPVPGDIQFDETYGRGTDTMTLPVLLVAGRADNRSAQKAIREYMNGSGARSVKAVLESGTYTSLDVIRVATAGVDGVTIAGTDYLAALFEIEIAGQGA